MTNYRPDLDGMRALAIIMVLGFHFFAEYFPGGFIGVDIFFVISGYLLAPKIYNPHENKLLSIVEFYNKRIVRIFPALFIILICCLIFGQLFLDNFEIKKLMLHISGSTVFIQNYILQSEINYFDVLAEKKPLLHLWSLSIEEQFYLVLPIIIFILLPLKKELPKGLLLIAAASFLYNISYTYYNDQPTFYLTFARLWQILMGVILFLATNSKVNPSFLSSLGIGLVILGTFTLSKNMNYPCWLAIIPTLGASLIITSNNNFINRKVLSHNFLTSLGKISYPLYLTHWPLLSFARIYTGETLSLFSKILILIGSTIAASLIYHFVEKPIRRIRMINHLSIVLLFSMLLLGAYSLYLYKYLNTKPIKLSHNDITAEYFFSYLKSNYYPCSPPSILKIVDVFNNTPRCFQSSNKPLPTIVLLGDSHAEHLFPGIAHEFKNYNVVYYLSNSLPLLSSPTVKSMIDEIIKNKSIKHILIANYWENRYEMSKNLYGNNYFSDELLNSISVLHQYKKSIYIIGDNPQFKFDVSNCIEHNLIINHCLMDRNYAYEKITHHNSLFQMIEKLDGIQYIDQLSYFCDNKTCSMIENGKLLYRDTHHLSIEGSFFVAKKLANGPLSHLLKN